MTWSGIGERNVAEMIRLADAGNTDAGRRVLELASQCLRDEQPLPNALRAWLAKRLESVVECPADAAVLLRVVKSKRHPHAHADSMTKRRELEAFQDMIAWATFRALAAKEARTSVSSRVIGARTVYDLVSEWAARRADQLESAGVVDPFRCSASQVKRWYESRRAGMASEQALVDAVAREFEHTPGGHTGPCGCGRSHAPDDAPQTAFGSSTACRALTDLAK
jgi:hypothetical protein